MRNIKLNRKGQVGNVEAPPATSHLMTYILLAVIFLIILIILVALMKKPEAALPVLTQAGDTLANMPVK